VIDWGDGSTSDGALSADKVPFDVSGSHTYANPGTYTTKVTVKSQQPDSTVTGTANVADAPLTATGLNLTVEVGEPFSGPVATFTDADPGGTAADYTVTIDWGDGSASANGTVAANGGGGFDANGSHTYATAGQKTATVTVTDAGGASATATSTVTVAAGAPPAGTPAIVAALGAGGGPNVRLFGVQGNLLRSFFAYDAAFTGGVFVAAGDVNGDKRADVVTGTGAGTTAHVKVFSGATGGVLRQFKPFTQSFTGGVRVAVGDVNGDGTPDVIAGAGPGGGPSVMAFSGKTGKQLHSFLAFEASFKGGVYVAAGDVNGDGSADIIAGAGPGGGPHVKVFSGKNTKVLQAFDAFSSDFTGGVRVAAGDVNGDGRADVVAGAGAGGGPHVKVFNGVQGNLLHSFFAFDPAFQGGVSVAAGDVNGDGRADVVAGAGPGGGPHVKAFSGVDGSPFAAFDAFLPEVDDEVLVAVAAGFLPAVQRFTLTRSVFRVASFRTPRVAASAAAAVARGTVFQYVLNGPGKVTIAIAQQKGKRYVRRGVLTRRGKRGVNRVRFSGRIGRKPLPAGRYRATISTSRKLPPRVVRFRIVSG
jgi:PKD repeat protein